MFQPEKVIAALEAKADHFAGYEGEVDAARERYERALETLAGLSREEIAARLAGIAWPGARPTAEHDDHPGLVIPSSRCGSITSARGRGPSASSPA